MRRFICGTRGSVSVYLIVVLVPIFLVQALFVDLIRIRAAARESEIAMKDGLRSVMSRYDLKLADYGLFGLRWEEESSRKLFLEVAERVLTPLEGKGLHYTDPKLAKELASLHPVYTLANPAVFERQIAQEMKVKAPVEFLTELADKFSKTGAAESYGKGADYYEGAAKLEALYWKREEALDEAWSAAQDLIQSGQSGTAAAQAALNRLQELAGRIGMRTADEIRQELAVTEEGIRDLVRQSESLESAMNSVQMSMAALSMVPGVGIAQLQGLQENLSHLSASLSSVQSELRQLNERKDKLVRLLEDIAEYTALFASAKAAIRIKSEVISVRRSKVEESLKEAMAAEQEWRKEWDSLSTRTGMGQSVRKEGNPYASGYPDSFYDAYRTGAATIAAAFQGLESRWNDVEWWNTARWEGLLRDVETLNNQLRSYDSTRRQQENERSGRNSELKKKSDEYKGKVASVMGNVKQSMGGCAMGADAGQELYTRLVGKEGLEKKYRAYHNLPQPTGTEFSMPGETDSAIGRGMGLMDRLKESANGLKDELLLNEYVLDKFNYRTRTEAVGGAEPKSRPAGHPLRQQEAEYALYGFGSCAGNIGAAYGELFLFLFAIRTVEAWMEPGTQAMEVGTPLLSVLAAAAKGAVRAAEDVKRLAEGGSVSLFSNFKAFEVTYKDCLRLFFLLHPNHNSVMARTQALVELNTGTDLVQTTTYVQGSMTTSVKLWFVPGILAKLNGATGLGCEASGNRCTIRKTAVYSYD
ncbi:hypothetical protein [Gorillibacterium sp. sgz5001074]|uniref:hypothetical protein n=1 Tax=Gorillibacterium sp. sgz5001074 TaxID=3446695 RepID=UPI003F66C536